MFAAVGGTKGAIKRQQIETWFATVSGQNISVPEAGHFKGTEKVSLGELHGNSSSKHRD